MDKLKLMKTWLIRKSLTCAMLTCQSSQNLFQPDGKARLVFSHILEIHIPEIHWIVPNYAIPYQTNLDNSTSSQTFEEIARSCVGLKFMVFDILLLLTVKLAQILCHHIYELQTYPNRLRFRCTLLSRKFLLMIS